MREYWGEFPPKIVRQDSLRLKYIDSGIMPGDGTPFEQWRNLVYQALPTRKVETMRPAAAIVNEILAALSPANPSSRGDVRLR